MSNILISILIWIIYVVLGQYKTFDITSKIDWLDEFSVSHIHSARQIWKLSQVATAPVLLLVLSLAFCVMVATLANHFGFEGQLVVAKGIIIFLSNTNTDSDLVLAVGWMRMSNHS